MRISDYSIQEYLAANGTETWRSGNQTVCRCPICKGDNDKKSGHNCQVNIDKNTIYCHSEQKTYTRTQLADDLGLRARLDIPEWDGTKEYKPKPPAHKSAPAKTEPTAPEPPKEISRKITYVYRDLAGNILYYRDRLEYTDGTKTVPYRKPADQKPVFYGLETLADPDGINYIFLTEGTKCADALRQALADTPGALDTTVLAFDKASEWEHIGQAAQDIILSKNIIIWADNDAPGAKNTAELSAYLKSAKSLRVVDFSDKPQAYDIADWLESGGTVGQAIKQYGKPVDVAALTQDVKPEPAKAEPDDYDKTIADLWNEVRPELILNKFYKKTLSIIAGNSGAGKTYISIQQAIRAAIAGKKVCLWPSEDIGFMGQRLRETTEFLNLSKEEIAKVQENLIIRYEVAKPIFSKKYGYERDEKAVDWFINYIQTRKLDLLILDSFNRFSSGLQENMPSEIGQFMNVWHEIALKTNCAVVFLHHLSQAGLSLTMESSMAEKQAAVRGAGAILATARANFIFLSDKEVKNKKYLQALDSSNYIESGKPEEYLMPFRNMEPELKQINEKKGASNEEFNPAAWETFD